MDKKKKNETPKTEPLENKNKTQNENTGFGEPIRRGPRLSPRPKNAPYHGGTRDKNSESNSENENE